jgi:signal transduction histidine kinase
MHATPALPLPTLSSAEAWVAAAALAGLRLEVAHTGRRVPIARTTRLAATAILQTALENAMRHADASAPARLEVAWRREILALRVLNVPGETALGQLLTPGLGISAMAARARAAGGWLRTGLCAEGFEVAAHLPIVPPVLTRAEDLLAAALHRPRASSALATAAG